MYRSVPFDLLTRESVVRSAFSCDASDLGWAPGFWPESIWAVAPSGHGMECRCTRVDTDGTHTYEADGTTIRVFND